MEKVIYSLAKDKISIKIPGVTKEVLNESYIFYFKNGEFIARETDQLYYLFLILDGRAKITTTEENGKRLILQFLYSSDLIGDLTIVNAEKNLKDVISIGSTICLGIPIKVVNSQLIKQNDFLFFIAQYIGKKLHIRMDHFKMQQTQELKIRLARLILEIAEDGIYHEKHTEIAEYLGVSYRHFMYTIKFFKDEKLIVKKDNYYLVSSDKIKMFIDDYSKGKRQ